MKEEEYQGAAEVRWGYRRIVYIKKEWRCAGLWDPVINMKVNGLELLLAVGGEERRLKDCGFGSMST